MTDIHLHNSDEHHRNVGVSVGDWTPGGGGILIALDWSEHDANQQIDIFIPASEALWLMARLPEALEVRLRDGEYWADLNDRRPIGLVAELPGRVGVPTRASSKQRLLRRVGPKQFLFG